MIIFKNIKAFTLAEVLITLAILGIVAAIIIPTIVGNFRKKQTEVGLLRAYTMLEKAFDMSQAINGPFETWDDVSANQPSVGEDFHKKYIMPYIVPVAYECSYYGNANKGIKDKDGCFKSNIKYINNTQLNSNQYCSLISGCAGNNISYRLKNGMSIAFSRAYQGFWGGCGLLITVDINGPDKGKNQLGADIFSFTFKYRNQVARITPRFETGRLGLNNYTFTKQQVKDNCFGTYSSGDGTWAGGLCSKYIEQNGWKIPKDYPIKF